jgi:hypothetical protein
VTYVISANKDQIKDIFKEIWRKTLRWSPVKSLRTSENSLMRMLVVVATVKVRMEAKARPLKIGQNLIKMAGKMFLEVAGYEGELSKQLRFKKYDLQRVTMLKSASKESLKVRIKMNY